MKAYQVNTIIFGLSAAPYLATRCLIQLARDEADRCLLASRILQQDLYVDDLITGARTTSEAIQIRNEIIQLLKSGGLHIRQWASNDKSLLQGLPEGSTKLPLSDQDATLKTLGLFWNSCTDAITYSVNPINLDYKISKRTILSQIARIYNPLGLLVPVIVVAKILMQSLWQLKLDWDESIPSDIYTTWNEYCIQLKLLNDLSFPRCVISSELDDIQIHGFCDASEKEYGACLNIRSSKQRRVSCHVFCAKSRVALLKTISLPRLELCEALLLANLYHTFMQATKLSVNRTIFWTDSNVTLNWINTEPHLLKTFSANRVSDIEQKTNAAYWRHVPTNYNPADSLSRGLFPKEFLHNSTWRHGPSWLVEAEHQWSMWKMSSITQIPELKGRFCLLSESQPDQV